MLAVDLLEKARGAEILVAAAIVDIGPEFARGAGDAGLAEQIFAALDQRRSEAEVEAEQGGLGCGALQRWRFPCAAGPSPPTSRSRRTNEI